MASRLFLACTILLPLVFYWEGVWVKGEGELACLCSARTRNLRNPRIAQCKLGIHTLPRNPGIAQPIPLLRIHDIDTSIASDKNATLDQ